jgi:hypothetical protein
MCRLNLLLFFLFLISINLTAQINDGGSQPLSLSQYTLSARLPTIQAPSLDMQSILSEDTIADSKSEKAPRFGVLISLNKGLQDGVWENLPNGDRIWRLQFHADQAKAVNLYFDDFHMPPGGKMHVYSPDYSQIIGGFGAHGLSSTLVGINQFDLMPNPSTGAFTININFAEIKQANIQITNVLGQVLEECNYNKQQISIPVNIAEQANGVYFVVLRTEQQSITKKITINK